MILKLTKTNIAFNIKDEIVEIQFHPFLHLVIKKRNLGIPVVLRVKNATW